MLMKDPSDNWWWQLNTNALTRLSIISYMISP
ncbi:Protein of unknown function [Pyronema omphalodes CBS 100304]|uniref:Uncharacterized protein n=1 Tax=Pyronema omphalodes (strain CBS 100304) TaxID=1076935 RepID=U4LG91_PYROM|nr:Protein of unknown function [Pyronema omphalodes CBS 100304]